MEWILDRPDTPDLMYAADHRDPQGGRLGLGARGQVTSMTYEFDQYNHQLVCAALLDPTLRDHVDRITALVQVPGSLVVFFVEEHGANMNYILIGGVTGDALTPLQDAARASAKLPSPDRAAFADALRTRRRDCGRLLCRHRLLRRAATEWPAETTMPRAARLTPA